jgi:WD40 repeat protein
MIGGTYAIPRIAFTVDGENLALANGDIIRVRDVEDQRFVNTLRGDNSIYSLGVSPDGRSIAAGDTASVVFTWDLSSEEPFNKLTIQKDEGNGVSTLVWDVNFSPDGSLVAAAGGDGIINIWDVTTGELITSLAEHHKAVSAVSFSPDSRTLASGGLDGTIYIWQTSR